MKCGRCSGLMVVEPVCEATGSIICGESTSTRCINCGNVEDAVIFTNRYQPRAIGDPSRHKIVPTTSPI